MSRCSLRPEGLRFLVCVMIAVVLAVVSSVGVKRLLNGTQSARCPDTAQPTPTHTDTSHDVVAAQMEDVSPQSDSCVTISVINKWTTEPIEHAIVSVWDLSESSGIQPTNLETDERGSTTIWLPPGNYRVQASWEKRALHENKREIHVDSPDRSDTKLLNVGASASVSTIGLAIPQCALIDIRGTCQADGEGISQVGVKLLPVRSGARETEFRQSWSVSVDCDDNGTYNLVARVPPGRYDLVPVETPWHRWIGGPNGPFDFPRIVVPAEGTSTTVDFEFYKIERAKITGMFLAEEGEPIVGMRVALHSTSGAGEKIESPSDARFETVTLSDGAFSLDTIAGERGTLVTVHPLYQSTVLPVVPIEKQTSIGSIALKKKQHEVSGVALVFGAPLRDGTIEIWVFSNRPAEGSFLGIWTISTDWEGNFAFRADPVERYATTRYQGYGGVGGSATSEEAWEFRISEERIGWRLELAR